jgi:phage-related protein
MNVYLDKEKVGSAIEPTVSEKQEQRHQAQIRRNGGNVVKT